MWARKRERWKNESKTRDWFHLWFYIMQMHFCSTTVHDRIEIMHVDRHTVYAVFSIT